MGHVGVTDGQPGEKLVEVEEPRTAAAALLEASEIKVMLSQRCKGPTKSWPVIFTAEGKVW